MATWAVVLGVAAFGMGCVGVAVIDDAVGDFERDVNATSDCLDRATRSTRWRLLRCHETKAADATHGADEIQAVVDPPQVEQTSPAPTPLCRKCATQARTDGDYCPFCGASYRRKRRLSKRGKIIAGAVLAAILAGGIATGVVLKIQHDSDVKAEQAREAEEAREAAKDREEAREEAEAEAALEEIELAGRRDLKQSLQKAITKDANESVATGLLTGPILKTSCNPIGGGSEDLSEPTGKYECLAVNEINGDGTWKGTHTTQRSITRSSRTPGNSPASD